MLRTNQTFTSLQATDDNAPTHSSKEQKLVEASVAREFARCRKKPENLKLFREQHVAYLLGGLEGLGEGYSGLDASRPWLCYWILNSLCILGEDLPPELATRVVHFLGRCQDRSGGFAGGPGQLPHLAPTYAAICSLMLVGTEEAYDIVDRAGLFAWLMRLKQPSGAFLMHDGGEVDTRAAYCAAHAATTLNVYTEELFEGTGDWIAGCQSWDGGISAVPGAEAHGGYTYCGAAALVLLGESSKLHLPSLIEWACNRQMRLEGGFQGRTNKLVDGCYSFWQGGLFPLLDAMVRGGLPCTPGEYRSTCVYQGDNVKPSVLPIPTGDDGDLLLNQCALQDYVLVAGQEKRGGLRDKPSKTRDYYHTCYCLSGLAATQHNIDGSTTVSGDPSNLVLPMDPARAVWCVAADRAVAHFSSCSPPPFPELV